MIILEIRIVRDNEKTDDIDQFFSRYNFDLNCFKFDREDANAR